MIAVDATSNTTASSGTTVTLAHTCTGSDRVLVVLCGGSTTMNATAVTYNGVSMTRVSNNTGQMDSQAWALADPDTGMNNIVVTKANNVETDVAAVSFNGAGGYVDTTNINNSFGTSADITLNTSTTKNGYVVTGLAYNDPGTLTYTGSGVEWAQEASGNGYYSAVYQSFSSGGNVSETWTSANSRSWGVTGIEIYELDVFKPIQAIF